LTFATPRIAALLFLLEFSFSLPQHVVAQHFTVTISPPNPRPIVIEALVFPNLAHVHLHWLAIGIGSEFNEVGFAQQYCTRHDTRPFLGAPLRPAPTAFGGKLIYSFSSPAFSSGSLPSRM
jgi:hypothetical protein